MGETNTINQEKKRGKAKRANQRGLTAVKSNKITVKTVIIIEGKFKIRTIRNQKD
jgi:hypothetical protein